MTEPLSKGPASTTQAFEVLRRSVVAPSPFAQILLGCLEQRATGSLAVTIGGRGRLWVRIEGGFPTAVAGEGLGSSVAETLLPLCCLQQGGYTFHDGSDRLSLLPGILRGRVDPYALLADAFRNPARAAHVQHQVSLSDARMLAVARGVNLARYRFTDEERRVADRLTAGPTSVSVLVADRELGASVVRRVVYVLEITGALLDLKARDESGKRPTRSSQPPQPEGLPEDPRQSYQREVTRPRRDSAPVEDTSAPRVRVGRLRDATLPLGGLLSNPSHLPPGALPPPPAPPSAPRPEERSEAAPASAHRTLTGASAPARSQTQAFPRPVLAAPNPTTVPKAQSAEHPIAVPPTRRRQVSPTGGYSVSRPDHGEEALIEPARLRRTSPARGTQVPPASTALPPASATPTLERDSEPPAQPLAIPAPTLGMSAVHRARWHEVIDRYRRLGTEDLFLALGVPRNVDAARLDSSFRSETARFQPSHLPPELSPVRPHAEAIVQALHRAYDVLRDSARRQAYLRKLNAR